jgi:hypothetical protein
MGCYINPPDQSKEAFLNAHGLPQTDHTEFLDWERVPTGMLPVVWVHNGYMTAAVICYKPSELEEIMNDLGGRPYQMYYVEIEALKAVSPLESYLARL